jgi:uncharacterized protein YgiM (DUF1202 family)
VYRSLGIPLPGDLGNAYAYAPKVPFSDLLPGDLLYFQNTVWPGLSHVAIYIGNGQFIHSEYFGVGVRISSFQNDPRDYNYWIQHYLGANRPWGGPVGAVPAPPTSGTAAVASTTTRLPSTVSSTSIPSGSTAIVTVSSLNVRVLPSKDKAVKTVIAQGTTVTVLHHGTSWSKVELADGTIGYVVNAGIGGSTTSTSVTTTGGTTKSQSGSGPIVTVGTPSAPTRAGQPAVGGTALGTVRSTVSSLNVHASPGVGGTVLTTVPAGTRMTVIKRSGGWLEVRLPSGQTGWVSATYATSTGTSTTRTSTTRTTSTGVAKKVSASVTGARATTSVSRAPDAVNVRRTPSLKGTVVTVLAPKGGYTVLGWTKTGGWAHVRLANGTTGWISGSALGITPATAPAAARATTTSAATGTRTTTSSTTTSTTSTSRHLGTGPNVVTVGVKVHATPSLKGAVVTVLAAGTHVTVIGGSGSWKLVKLPTGGTGYVYGSYVK